MLKNAILHWYATLAVVFFVMTPPARGAENVVDSKAATITFERHIRPILKANCFQCHGEEGRHEGSLDVRLRRLLVAGGDSGSAVEPGKPDESYLVERLHNKEMPPGKETPKLSAIEIETIEKWIAAGAPTARPEPENPREAPLVTEEERAHWAFQPIRRPEAPKPQASALLRTPIDAFLLSRLEQEGLTFSPDADRGTLIRRATFDLHGIPPTPEEVDAFISDPSPQSYERLIDRLLESPLYGERWGRHWLDVAGYADSEGYNDADVLREDAYKYRDYVIRALNADKPFDDFIREQLAGDELVAIKIKSTAHGIPGPQSEGGTPTLELDPETFDPVGAPDELEKLTATGFLRMAPDGTGTKEDNTEIARNAVVAETLKIVSSSLLGLTVGCAQCHDHRYDPIPQKDYYRLRAVFEPAFDCANWKQPPERQISLMTRAQRAEAERLEQEAREIEAEFKTIYKDYRDWAFEKELATVPEAAREAALAWQQGTDRLTQDQKTLLENYPTLTLAVNYTSESDLIKVRGLLAKHDGGKSNKNGRWSAYLNALDAIRKRANAMREQKPKEDGIRALTEPASDEPPLTYVFLRGDLAQRGEAVSPGDLTVVSDGSSDFPADDPALTTTGRRLAFANWLTSGRHPLVARVLVNRFWLHHFGRGLVSTPGDFGTQGDLPTHPELLDWLAAEFMNRGWSLKAFHRLVMTSTAYRQSSARRVAEDAVDADNQFYWRMPLKRLEAESVRDAILAVSGNLNLQEFGPPVPVGYDGDGQAVVGVKGMAGVKVLKTDDGSEFRRSVYVQVRRSAPAYILDAFDGPEMDPNCELRRSSTVTQQSLVLMNSQFIVEQADRFADRLVREVGADIRAQARRAWRLAFAREPGEVELVEMCRFLERQREFLAADSPSESEEHDKGDDIDRPALASLCQVLLSSNQFLYVE